MPQHDRQLSLEPAQVGQQVGALAGMRLDHRELLVGEPARLVQDLLGHLQLADVVEQPGHGQTAQRRRRQAHLHAHPHSQGGHPPRVLAGGGIAQLHGRGHAADVAAQQALLGLEQVAALHPAVEVVGGHLPGQVDGDRAGHGHEADRLQHVRRPEHQRPGVRQQVDHDRAAQPDQAHGDREIGAAAGQLVRDEGPARDPEVDDADREQHDVHPRLHLQRHQRDQLRMHQPDHAEHQQRREGGRLAACDHAGGAVAGGRCQHRRGQDHAPGRNRQHAGQADGGVAGVLLEEHARRGQAVDRHQAGHDGEGDAHQPCSRVVPADRRPRHQHRHGGGNGGGTRDREHVQRGQLELAVHAARSQRHKRRQG